MVEYLEALDHAVLEQALARRISLTDPQPRRTGASVDSPRDGEQLGTSRGGVSRRLRADATQMAVASIALVEDLDVVEDIGQEPSDVDHTFKR
ncbi:hypothetical protein GCM10025795_09720 [Verticiella sediminum]